MPALARDARSAELTLALTPQDNGRRQAPPLPSALLELGNSVIGLRIAETKIADEFPIGRNVEQRCNRRGIEDRDPAHANTLRARGEPDRVHRRHRRIVDHFRHGVAAEAVALGRRAIGEHRQVTGRLLQARELELRVEAGPIAALRGERLRVAGCEILPNGGAGRGVLDDDKAPWLAQAYGRRETGKLDQRFQRAARQRVAPETPDIAAPDEKLAQARAECRIEASRALRCAFDLRYRVGAHGRKPSRCCGSHPPQFAVVATLPHWPASRNAATSRCPEICVPKFRRGRGDGTARAPPAFAPTGTTPCHPGCRDRRRSKCRRAVRTPPPTDDASLRSTPCPPRPRRRWPRPARTPPMVQASPQAGPRTVGRVARNRAV